ncbi:MAG: hypothetical protein IPM54_04045 [Polyangiaceae bacterium]|nr:hypothetical protein [Polyangiaceae bacterium]
MSDDSKLEKPVKLALIRRNPWILGISALPLLTAFAFLGIGLYSTQWIFLLLIPHLLIMAGALFAMLWIRNPRPREVEDAVSVSKEGVRFGQTLALPRERIEAGFVVPRPGKRPIVRIEKKGIGLPTEIRVENEDEGREVLRELGLDASQTIASFALPSRIHARIRTQNIFAGIFIIAFALLFLIILITGSKFNTVGPFLGVPGFAFLLFALFTRTHLRVGADGVALRWFGRERFIPYDEVAAIEPYEEQRTQWRHWAGVHLKLRSGEVITLPIASVGDVGGPRTRLVTRRLQEALADHQRGARASAEARLARGERPMLAWVRELRQAGSGAAANHRVAPVPTDRLLELAEDPRADPVTRASAAVALGAAAESDDIRDRLRVAARATAAPRLRIAIERAALVDDEAQLAEALAEVEAEAKNSDKNRRVTY